MKMALRKKTHLDGIASVEDAVHARQRKITTRKFIYSRRNSWEIPGVAFARGQGCCAQQAFALKKSAKSCSAMQRSYTEEENSRDPEKPVSET